MLEGEPETAPGAVEAALDSVRRSQERGQRNQIKTRIREAERAGQWEEALRLTAELDTNERAARKRG